MKRSTNCAGALLMGLLCPLGWAQAPEPAKGQSTHERIVVFATEAHPVDIGARPVELYYVDASNRLEEAFSAGMPADPVAAEAWATAKLASPEGQQFMRAVGPASVGLSLAWQWGIEAFPAVVFERADRHYVVYGAASLAAAEEAWGSYQSTGAQP